MSKKVKVTTKDRYQKVAKDLIDKITDYIEGKEECPPWIKPWRTIGRYRNPITGTIYKGFNIVILSMTPYDDPRWLTGNGIKQLGGFIKKGEKATWISHYNTGTKIEVDEKTGEEVEKKYRYTVFHPVFNVLQCEDLEIEPLPEVPLDPKGEDIEEVELWLKDLYPKVLYGGNKACYNSVLDSIRMPSRTAFVSYDEFYSTIFHEYTHSTGHASRLCRDLRNKFGSPKYAFEELIAELGSAMLCHHFGVNGNVQHVEYLRNWLSVLKDDPQKLLDASYEASRAATFLLKSLNDSEEKETA